MFVAADHAAFEQSAGTEDVLHARSRSAAGSRCTRSQKFILLELVWMARIALFAHTLIQERRFILQRTVNTLDGNDFFRVVPLLSFL